MSDDYTIRRDLGENVISMGITNTENTKIGQLEINLVIPTENYTCAGRKDGIRFNRLSEFVAVFQGNRFIEFTAKEIHFRYWQGGACEVIFVIYGGCNNTEYRTYQIILQLPVALYEIIQYLSTRSWILDSVERVTLERIDFLQQYKNWNCIPSDWHKGIRGPFDYDSEVSLWRAIRQAKIHVLKLKIPHWREIQKSKSKLKNPPQKSKNQ